MRPSPAVDLPSLQSELNALRARTLAELGADDAAHIAGVRRVAGVLQVAGRTLIHFSLEPVSFGLGVLALGTYKILENMEIGHNVSHGQYDFLDDPTLQSKTYEWDIVGTAKTWRHAHNVTHHVYTNVLGKDDDFGYTFFRLSSEVPWKPHHLTQILSSLFVGLTFDHMVSYYHARPSEYLTAERGTAEWREQLRRMLSDWAEVAVKTARHHGKEFLLYPALAGPFAPKVALGNLLAQAVRNVWSYAVIHCGHLTPQTSVFSEEDFAEETRGGYYLRQMLGSANIEAGPWLGVLTGHLSHQIEHHLFPDIPAWRYPKLASEVRRIADKHGIPYHTGSLWKQYGSVLRAMLRYAVPSAPSDAHRRVPAATGSKHAEERLRIVQA